VELARRSGINNVTIYRIESGKVKPRDLTWRRLMKALPMEPAEAKQPKDDPPEPGFGEVLDRENFFRKLRLKMSESLFGVLDQSCIIRIVEASEFFSRYRFYPGDFATAVELLNELRKEWRRQAGGDMADREKRPYRRRRIPQAKEESKIKFGNPGRWPKKR
jgi:transcriptional regulator with XRE-family HTH domain